MKRILGAIVVLSVFPALGVGAYFYVPEFTELVHTTLRTVQSTNSGQSNSLVRYVDGQGRQFYVSSLDAVPSEYRSQAEVDLDLPSVNRGEFQLPPTPVPTPVKPKRGGDGVIKNRRSQMERMPAIGTEEFSDSDFGEDEGVYDMIKRLL